MKDIIAAILLVLVTIICTPPGWIGMILLALIIQGLR